MNQLINDLLDQDTIIEIDDSVHYRDYILINISALKILWKTEISTYPEVKKLWNSIVEKIIQYNKVDTFKLLLDHGYELEVLNEDGQSALHYAFYNRSYSIIEAYLNCQPFKKDNLLDWADSNGLTHLHIICSADHENVLEIVKIFLKNGSDVNACYYSEPTNRKCGSTPLHFAMPYDRFDVVKLLLENGADINAVNAKGETPFDLARKFMNELVEEKMELFINCFKADIEARDKRGDTALLSVFDDPDIEFEFDITFAKQQFNVLIRNGANILAKNNNGDTVLHLILKTLRIRDGFGNYKYESFNDSEHAKLVEQVLKSNNDLIEMKNNEDKTPLQLAVSMASADIVKILLNHKASTSSLKIVSENEIIFCYPPIVPTFDIVQNIISIIDLLVTTEFKFSLEDHLMIMKFLVHDADISHCSCVDDDNYSISTVIQFGTGIHAKQAFDEWRKYYPIYSGSDLPNDLYIMEEANFYMPKELEKIMISLPRTETFILNKKARKKLAVELAILKSDVKLKNGMMLYDVMLNPYKASRFLKDDNFDQKLTHGFSLLEDIILGFVTKAIVRNYIVETAYEFVTLTPLSFLPAVCFDIVLSYLSNIDIFKLCATALVPESNDLISNEIF